MTRQTASSGRRAFMDQERCRFSGNRYLVKDCPGCHGPSFHTPALRPGPPPDGSTHTIVCNTRPPTKRRAIEGGSPHE